MQVDEKVDKLQVDLKNTQDAIARGKDQIHVLQEQMDRELVVINARQNDVQRSGYERFREPFGDSL